MNIKEKARQDAATSERAKRREKHRAGGNSHNNFITGDGPISRYLLQGKINAIPRRELEQITGLDGRAVRLLIERERRSGTPILSDCSHGYYLPGDDMEKAACVRSLRHRARQIWVTARAIEGPRNSVLDGQISLQDVDK